MSKTETKEVVITGGEIKPTGTPGVSAQNAVAVVKEVADVDLGDVLATIAKLAQRLDDLERNIDIAFGAYRKKVDGLEEAVRGLSTPASPKPADAAPDRLDRIEAALAMLIGDPGALSADAGHLDRCRITLAADGAAVPVSRPPGVNAPRRDTNSDAALERRYAYHPPKGTQTNRYAEIRAKVLETAKFIRDRTPPSPEQTRAFNSLHDAMMLSNAAIACNE